MSCFSKVIILLCLRLKSTVVHEHFDIPYKQQETLLGQQFWTYCDSLVGRANTTHNSVLWLNFVAYKPSRFWFLLL